MVSDIIRVMGIKNKVFSKNKTATLEMLFKTCYTVTQLSYETTRVEIII